MEPIRININRERDGCYYELDPVSRSQVGAARAEARVAPMVFIGYKSEQDFDALHGPLWLQIARLLTGLSDEELEEFGGVVLYDPVGEREVRSVPVARAA